MPNNYSKINKIFGVLFGLVLVTASGTVVYLHEPNLGWEILVSILFLIGFFLIGAWGFGKSKWGIFFMVLILGFPIMIRHQWLSLASISIWLLILGLTALIN